MSVINHIQTRSIIALDLSTATQADVADFLTDSGYTSTPLSDDRTGTKLNVLYPINGTPSSAGRMFFNRKQYLVKIGNKMQRPVNLNQFATLYANV
jgi:hypothetical protein